LKPEEMRITIPHPKSGEAFPVGVAIDYSVPFQILIGEEHMITSVLNEFQTMTQNCFKHLLQATNPYGFQQYQ